MTRPPSDLDFLFQAKGGLRWVGFGASSTWASGWSRGGAAFNLVIAGVRSWCDKRQASLQMANLGLPTQGLSLREIFCGISLSIFSTNFLLQAASASASASPPFHFHVHVHISLFYIHNLSPTFPLFTHLRPFLMVFSLRCKPSMLS